MFNVIDFSRNIFSEHLTDIYNPPSPSFMDIDINNMTMIDSELKALELKEKNCGTITPTTAGPINSIIYDPIALKELCGKLYQHSMEVHQFRLANPNKYGVVESLVKAERILCELHHIMNTCIFTKEYQVNLPSVSAAAASTTSPEGPSVTRFGIYRDALKIITSDKTYVIGPTQLHLVEKEIFKFALVKLNTQLSYEEFKKSSSLQEFAENVVVVDIFARNKDCTIKITADNLPERHSIVLWKTSKTNIFILDPTRIGLSSHICESLNKLYKTDGITFLLSKKPPETLIYSSSVKVKNPTEDKAKIDLPRDCVDIAVKMAFEINELQKEIRTNPSIDIPIDKIEDKVYNQISNQKKLTITPLGGIDGTHIRNLQSSQNTVRKAAKEFLTEYRKEVLALSTSGNPPLNLSSETIKNIEEYRKRKTP